MAVPKALVCVGLLFLAFAAAGAADVKTEANDETWELVTGRNLLGWYWVDNSGDVWGKQTNVQASGAAIGNKGPVNQQSANIGGNVNGYDNAVSIANSQNQGGPNPPPKKEGTPGGRKLLGNPGWVWYPNVDNSGNVGAKQTNVQASGLAAWNQGPVNQQSANLGGNVNGYDNGVAISNSQNQGGPNPPPKKDGAWGRKLLGSHPSGWYWVDNSGDVWGKQTNVQASGAAIGNKGPVNQQSANIGGNVNGYDNAVSIANSQNQGGPNPPPNGEPPKTPGGRKLLGHSGGWYWVDNSGDVWGKQTNFQFSGLVAGNSGPVNQQSANIGANVNGYGNGVAISNSQTQNTKPGP